MTVKVGDKVRHSVHVSTTSIVRGTNNVAGNQSKIILHFLFKILFYFKDVSEASILNNYIQRQWP